MGLDRAMDWVEFGQACGLVLSVECLGFKCEGLGVGNECSGNKDSTMHSRIFTRGEKVMK